MESVNGILLSFLGFVLICIAHGKHRDAARPYLRPVWLITLPWLGWGVLASSVACLLASKPGDLGLIVWFGLHPVLILAISLIAASSMRALVVLAKLTPVGIAVVWLTQLVGVLLRGEGFM